MRKGTHPLKSGNNLLHEHGIHRVIVPVYLPNSDGYYKFGFEILSLCIKTLLLTVDSKTNITIVLNETTHKVKRYLYELLETKKIDQLIINRFNHGKLDSILSVARGCFEDFITFVDCDAFFYPGWESSIADVFNNFHEAGWVSSQPAPDTTWLNSCSTIFLAFSKGCLRKFPVMTDKNLDRFGESLGRPEMYKKRINEFYLAVERNNAKAIVGGNHFAFTIRRAVLEQIPIIPANKFIAEEMYFGQYFDRTDFWRLSTPELLIQHMGNVSEEWMYKDLEEIIEGFSEEKPNWPTKESKVRQSIFPFIFRKYFCKVFRKYNFIKYLSRSN